MEKVVNTPHAEESRSQKAKKFVFQAYGDNIEFVESLSAEEKNTILNTLLSDYQKKAFSEWQNQSTKNLLKKIAITILIVVIGTPLFIKLVNFSFDVTINSYSVMQKNFEKLFD